MTIPPADAWAEKLGLVRTGHEWHGPCPLCGGEDRFHVRDGHGHKPVIGCRGCIDGEPPEVRRQNFGQIVRIVFGEQSTAALSDEQRRRIARERAERERLRRRDAERAARNAHYLVNQSVVEPHPYLAAKGFPEHQVHVYGGHIVIPLRRGGYGNVVTVQLISPDGQKKFLKGSDMRGAHMVLGRGRETWVAEGFATALSVSAALRRMQRSFRIKVAFSAHNVRAVAQHGDLIVADHDPWICPDPDCKHRFDHEFPGDPDCPECGAERCRPPAGQRHAALSGSPWWIPPVLGDANDYHLAEGLPALSQALKNFHRETMAQNRKSGLTTTR